jgi:transglutaminase-like putative cysteine protease
VLEVTYKNQAIPHGAPREPKNVYLAKSGFCYDRSRVIEKVLRNAGLKTRHISIYSTKKTKLKTKSLIMPGVESHALTEVFTQKGWMVVDPNDP